jgi:hypothetical protein
MVPGGVASPSTRVASCRLSLIGGSAAFLLYVPQDWVLLASFLFIIPMFFRTVDTPRGAAAISA